MLRLFLFLMMSVFVLWGCEDYDDFDFKSEEVQSKKEESGVEKFIKETGITLTAKEVEYNTSNNLDKLFYIEGIVVLCDYYNYGYKNEKDFFCGKMATPEGSTWYLYFNRDSFEGLYKALLTSPIDIVVSAKVLRNRYKTTQGNMAAVYKVRNN